MSSPHRALAGRLGLCMALVLGLMASLLAGPAQAEGDFLDPAAAFRLSVQALDAHRLALRFDVAPGYHLYRERISLALDPAGAVEGELRLPPGTREFDAGLQQTMEVYRQAVTLVYTMPAAPASAFLLHLTHQGCADQGLCYPPATQTVWVAPPAAGESRLAARVMDDEPLPSEPATRAPVQTPSARAGAVASGASDAASPLPADDSRFQRVLASRQLFAVAGVFMLAGLLLSFTPCVLPMVPILSSIIVGQRAPPTRGRGLALAAAYSGGMALVYTGLGVAAGLAGEGLAAALQNAWVLGGFALLLAALAVSMFGVYELQLPSAWQGRLTMASGRLQGGRFVSVFAMGALSALIVGPCVAAPLAGALVYISRTQDVLLGGTALFAMAAGMSVPLLVMGAAAPGLLPRAGAWMDRVKHFFGALLLAVALWIVAPVLPTAVTMLLLAGLLLSAAVYLGAFERLERRAPAPILGKGLGLGLAALALMQLAGAASGGRDPWQPLVHLAGGPGIATAESARAAPAAPRFEPVGSLAALEDAVQRSSKPVLVDFYADWCTACKELESLSFSDREVRQRLAGFTLLRADVTANTPQQQALMRRFSLFGPPALLFFQAAGAELETARVIGFKDAADLSRHLERLVRADAGQPSTRQTTGQGSRQTAG